MCIRIAGEAIGVPIPCGLLPPAIKPIVDGRFVPRRPEACRSGKIGNGTIVIRGFGPVSDVSVDPILEHVFFAVVGDVCLESQIASNLRIVDR